MSVNGTAPFTYQWQKNGSNIVNAIASTYSIVSTQATDTGNYTVMVSNTAGSTTSDVGLLTVQNLAFTTQPVSQSVATGASVTFTAAATGSPAPTYQWQLNGANIAGATSASLTLSNVQASNAGTYAVVASNTSGSLTSNGAVLTIQSASAPAITTQPASQTVSTGSSVTFTAVATGSPVPTFQWQFNGANLAGATSASLTVANVQLANAGNYSVVATNLAGSATSNWATLTVNAASSAPAITTQPQSQTVAAGANVTFTAAAAGSPAPTFQWRLGGINITGATSASLSLTNVQSVNAGSYTLVATNGVGSATSSVATLTVNAGGNSPTITTQPISQTVFIGSSVTLTAAASGSPAPTFQWKKNGTTINGATSATLVLSNVQASDAGSYSVVATNASGSATSLGALITVNSPVAPAITTQPVSQTVAPGATATFTTAASGAPAPSFQWQKNGANISGATSATLSLANVQTGDAGSYTVVAFNSAGSATSSTATLTVSATTASPVITTQPASQTVAVNSSATFTVSASGNPTPTYQWRKNGVNVPGATSSSYTIPSVTTGDAGNYAAVATNSAGTATSTAATLTVSNAPTAPAITAQPASVTVPAGGSASFSVGATGNPAPTYQWYFAGTAISGATSATLSLSNVQSANVGGYYVTVTNGSGTIISNTAQLTVQASAPVTLLANQSVTPNHNVAIVVPGVIGTMQWQSSSNGGLTWQNLSDNSTYSGTNSNTLEIINVSSSLNGTQYRCLVSGVASTSTTLSVVQGYFTSPTSVGADSAGNLYVSDATANTLQKISSAGQVTLVAGSSGQTGTADGSGSAARFNQPVALAAAPDGTLSVSDMVNSIVRSVSSAGAVTTLAGLAGNAGAIDGTGSAARFSGPVGIARDSNGVLYVADSLNNTIRKITTGGVVTTLAGTTGAAGTADGTGAAARFNNPTGLAVDLSGNVYVADSGNHTIRRITTGGTVTTLAGLAGVSGTQDGTGSGARFYNPGGLTVSVSGDLYLADTGNSTIRKITTTGVVTTIAGMPRIAGLMDGSGGYDMFNQPEGLTLGTDGNLYVADTGNGVIRQVTLDGTVATMALSTGVTPTPAPAPTPTPSVTPPPTPAPSSGGGGGAMNDWLVLALGLLCLLRWIYSDRPRVANHSR